MTPEPQSWEVEIAWLKDSDVEVACSLADVLDATLQLVTPLAAKRGVRLNWQLPGELEPVAILPAALRQCLVSLTTYAIGQAVGDIHFMVEQQLTDVCLSLIHI